MKKKKKKKNTNPELAKDTAKIYCLVYKWI